MVTENIYTGIIVKVVIHSQEKYLIIQNKVKVIQHAILTA